MLNIKHFIVYWDSLLLLSSCMYGHVLGYKTLKCYGNEGYIMLLLFKLC